MLRGAANIPHKLPPFYTVHWSRDRNIADDTCSVSWKGTSGDLESSGNIPLLVDNVGWCFSRVYCFAGFESSL